MNPSDFRWFIRRGRMIFALVTLLQVLMCLAGMVLIVVGDPLIGALLIMLGVFADWVFDVH